MTSRTPFLIAMLIFVALVAIAQYANANARTVTLNVPDSGCITVRHLSVPGGNAVLDTFEATSFDSVQGPIWNFSGTCNTPPPPIDPGAYTMLAVSWLGDAPTPHTIDVTRCENLWGRMTFAQTPILGWPYRTPTVRWNKTDNRYLRCRITMPANPGTLSHSFKTVNYSSLIPVKMALVAPGAPWPTGARTACFIPLTVNDQPALYVNPGVPNTSKCSLGANQQADLLIDSANGQRGQIGVANY